MSDEDFPLDPTPAYVPPEWFEMVNGWASEDAATFDIDWDD